jgi:hypothetical protein
MARERERYFVADEITGKIILLFIFEKMEIPLSENTMTEIIMCNPDWISYMDYRLALGGITESKFVVTKTVAGDTMYLLSQDGRMCLSHFFTKIPASIREEIINYAHDNVLRMKRNQEYTFDYYKNTNGTHTVVLKIKDCANPESMMEIKINVSTRTDAVRASQRWKDKAPEVYESIWEILVEKEEEEKNKGENKDEN